METNKKSGSRQKTQSYLNFDTPAIFYDKESEEAVLGALLMDSDNLHEVSFLTPEMFWNKQHEEIFRALLELDNKGGIVDVLTLWQQIQRAGQTDLFPEGVYSIALLQSNGSLGYHITAHAYIIKEQYDRRKLFEAAANTMQMAVDATYDVDTLVNDSLAQFERVEQSVFSTEDTKEIKELAISVLSDYYKREEAFKNGLPSGVDTGSTTLNTNTGGWQNGDLIILAGRPSMGKTAYMLALAKAAAKSGTPAAIFSLEMTKEQLTNRLLLSEATNVNTLRFKNGCLSADEVSDIEVAGNVIHQLPIVIDDKPNQSTRQIKSKCKRLKKKGKLGIVFIDYLQLMDMQTDNRNYGREEEVSMTSRGLKNMAKELDVPVVVLSQLNRKCEERSDRRPIMSDLRESGAIEQDADIIAFTWRPMYYKIKEYGQFSSTIGLLIIDMVKNRNGMVGEIYLHHNQTISSFEEFQSTIHDEDTAF